MSKLIYSFRWWQPLPSLENITRTLGLSPDEVDQTFGVIEVDPEQNLLCILAEEEALQRLNLLDNLPAEDGSGAFANARIEPMHYQPATTA